MADDRWAARGLAVLSKHLAEVGLTIQPSKTAIYSPSHRCPEDEHLAECWQKQPDKDGIVLCGAPIWEDFDDSDHSIPIGSDSFIGRFLSRHTSDYCRRLQVLRLLPDVMSANGCHMAMVILRKSMLYRFQHLCQWLPPRVLQAQLHVVDAMVQETAASLLQIPSRELAASRVFKSPASMGGLGITPLAGECHLLYLSMRLGVRLETVPWPEPLHTWSSDEQDAIQQLEHTAGAILNKDLGTLLTQGFRRSLHRFRKVMQALPQGPDGSGLATELACLIANGVELHPGMIPAMHKAAVAWWTADAYQFMPDRLLRQAVRRRLGLAEFALPARCQHLVQGHRCNADLGTDRDHHHKCARGAINRRHNKLRDTIIALARRAGWTALPEQEVRLPADAQTGESAAPFFKRADVLLTSAQGMVVAGDIAVCTIAAGQSSAGAQHRAAQAKRSSYKLTGETTGLESKLPDGSTFEPWVLTSHGVWHPVAFQRLRTIAKDMAMVKTQQTGESDACTLQSCLVEVFFRALLCGRGCRV